MTDTSLHQLLTLAGVRVDAGLKQTGFYCDPVPAIEVRFPPHVPQRIANAAIHALAFAVELASLPAEVWLVYVAHEVHGGYVYLELGGGGTDDERDRALACLARVIASGASATDQPSHARAGGGAR
jgi:hypothetical protein